MRKRGIRVALGTDGAASNNRLDVMTEMRAAALLAKGTSGDAAAVPAAEALEMATIEGARAIGLDRDIGSIEAGKWADLAAVELASIETLPCYDPVSHLTYAAGREHVTHVWVAGEARVSDRALQNFDEADVTAKAAWWRGKMAS
jgi:5-methylthioadenosine/S-adenosylhomocysteine deaminase